MIHNRPLEGTVVTSYTEYAKGKSVQETSTNNSDLQLLSQRLHEIIGDGQSYSLLGNNCEHIAHFLIHGRKISPQVQAATISAAIGEIIGKRKGNLAYGLIFGGIVGLVAFNMLKKYDYSIGWSEMSA